MNFKPIFEPPLKKIVKVTPVLGGVCASKIWSFSSVRKFGGAEYHMGQNMVFQKSRFG